MDCTLLQDLRPTALRYKDRRRLSSTTRAASESIGGVISAGDVAAITLPRLARFQDSHPPPEASPCGAPGTTRWPVMRSLHNQRREAERAVG